MHVSESFPKSVTVKTFVNKICLCSEGFLCSFFLFKSSLPPKFSHRRVPAKFGQRETESHVLVERLTFCHQPTSISPVRPDWKFRLIWFARQVIRRTTDLLFSLQKANLAERSRCCEKFSRQNNFYRKQICNGKPAGNNVCDRKKVWFWLEFETGTVCRTAFARERFLWH